MQKNDILKFNDELIRILQLNTDTAYIISITHPNAPKQANIEDLKEWEIVKELDIQYPEPNEKQQHVMWHRYKIILPLILNACNKRKRTRLLKEISKAENITMNTLKNWLYKYLGYQKFEFLLI